MVSVREKLKKEEERALLTFLKQTTDGKYAKIDRSSLSYARIEIRREPSYDEEYNYSIR